MTKKYCLNIIKYLQLHSKISKINTEEIISMHCINIDGILIPSPSLYIAYKTNDANVLSYSPGQIVIKKTDSNALSPFNHKHVRLFHEYLSKIWIPPKVLFNIFLPCTQKKPYRRSITHKLMLYYVDKLRSAGVKVTLYSISEPMLIVPYVLEPYYPLSNYDFPPKLMTKEEKKTMERLLAELLPKFIKSARYNMFILPRHHFQIVQNALLSSSLIDKKKNKLRNHLNDPHSILMFRYGRLAFQTISNAYRTMLELVNTSP